MYTERMTSHLPRRLILESKHNNVYVGTGGDLGGLGGLGDGPFKKFEVGGRPMHPSPQYFEK